jgi:ABC-type nitrate/sulfonate/bicarbonate transport system substrate-binding protein
MISALQGKAIDACEEVEPFVTRAVSLGLAVAIADLADFFPNEQYAHLFFSQKFISSKAKLAQAFVEAYVRGIRKYYELGPYHDTVLASLEKHTKVKKEVMKKLIPVVFDINGDINMEGLKRQHDWFAKGGMSQRVDLNTLVDRTFLKRTWEKIGKKQNPGKEWWEKIKLST